MIDDDDDDDDEQRLQVAVPSRRLRRPSIFRQYGHHKSCQHIKCRLRNFPVPWFGIVKWLKCF